MDYLHTTACIAACTFKNIGSLISGHIIDRKRGLECFEQLEDPKDTQENKNNGEIPIVVCNRDTEDAFS